MATVSICANCYCCCCCRCYCCCYVDLLCRLRLLSTWRRIKGAETGLKCAFLRFELPQVGKEEKHKQKTTLCAVSSSSLSLLCTCFAFVICFLLHTLVHLHTRTYTQFDSFSISWCCCCISAIATLAIYTNLFGFVDCQQFLSSLEKNKATHKLLCVHKENV